MTAKTSARERALDSYGPSAVAAPVQPSRAEYDGAHRGDVVRVASKATALGRRYVVAGVSRLTGSGWGYDLILIQGKDDPRLSSLSYTSSTNPLPAIGVWDGTIAEGARGTVEPCPSDKAGTNPAVTNHNAPEGRREAKMATVTRKGAKTAGTKAATTKAATTKANPAATKPSKAKFAPSKAEVTAIAKRLREGAKMNDLKAEFGLSNGQPIRNALREHGFDSKGATNPEGLTARELQAARRASGEDKPAAKASGKTTRKTTTKRATAAKDPS